MQSTVTAIRAGSSRDTAATNSAGAMGAQAPASKPPGVIGTRPGTTVPFDVINGPGAYICNWSGHLLRVPEEEVAHGRSPRINMVGPEPLTVTKISDDPGIALSAAKLLAADYQVATNF